MIKPEGGKNNGRNHIRVHKGARNRLGRRFPHPLQIIDVEKLDPKIGGPRHIDYRKPENKEVD